MKNIVIIIFLIFTSNLLNAQLRIDRSGYDKLLIVDEFNNNYSIIYGNIYELDLKDTTATLKLIETYRLPDTLLEKYQKVFPEWQAYEDTEQKKSVTTVNDSLINELIYLLNNPNGFSDLTENIPFDSLWHLQNKDRLFSQWVLQNSNAKKFEVRYADYVLMNYFEFKRIFYSHILQSNTSGYSNVTIAFENQSDTLIFNSYGQQSYYLPWVSDSTYKNYNPQISKLISKLIPEDLSINNEKLNPSEEKLEKDILKQLTFKSYFINKKKFKKFLKEKDQQK